MVARKLVKCYYEVAREFWGLLGYCYVAFWVVSRVLPCSCYTILGVAMWFLGSS